MHMPTFDELKKLAKRAPEPHENALRIAVVGDCATQFLACAISGCAVYCGHPVRVLDTDYNQIDAQLMDGASETYAFKPDMLLLYLSSEKLYQAYCEASPQRRMDFAAEKLTYIRNLWAMVCTKKPGLHIVQTTFVQLDDGVLGSAAAKTPASFLFQIRKLNFLLSEAASHADDLSLLDLDAMQSKLGRKTFFDDKLFLIAKSPISHVVLPMVAQRVMDLASALRGELRKCVVLDLDNTLWGGVIGDDGLEGIQIGELGTGVAFTQLQRWLLELKKRGILLAVCSKNNDDTARLPFEQHPEMLLRLSDFAMFVANWEDKAGNIRKIQQTLNIGMDSMIFLDDNPFERNVVRGLIPEITVPELPEDPALYLSYLQSLNLFETVSFSVADLSRTQQYQEEGQRTQTAAQFASYDEYLQSLEMAAHVAPFDAFHTPRIAQLTQRSNQFNLRTRRYTEADVERLANDPRYLTQWYELKDKFGDYGLISVVVLEEIDKHTLFIDTWLMSCRVLKRGMERFIINKMVALAHESGYITLVGEYLPTPKNAMVKDIYENMGFTPLGNSRYQLDIVRYQPELTFIKEE